jgi:hypothetical protein
VLGEDVGDKGIGNVYSSSSISSQYEDAFLGEVVDNDKDGGVTIGRQKLLNKIHAYRVPGSLWNGKQLKESIGAMAQWLVAHTEHTL